LAHRAWLAFDRVDAPGFSIRKRESGEEKRVQVGPFYLVWENLQDPQILQEADYGWPYQVVAVDLIRTLDRFPRMTPPEGAPRDVASGFEAFRIHCSKCHQLNGEGGTIGPELNAATRPVEYRDREWLRTWIENPAKLLPTARMPRLNPALPNRARTIDEILAYLTTMSAQAVAVQPGDPSVVH
jgi:cytochrome c2